MANPVREMNTVADGRKGDPQQDVEGKRKNGRSEMESGEMENRKRELENGNPFFCFRYLIFVFFYVFLN